MCITLRLMTGLKQTSICPNISEKDPYSNRSGKNHSFEWHSSKVEPSPGPMAPTSRQRPFMRRPRKQTVQPAEWGSPCILRSGDTNFPADGWRSGRSAKTRRIHPPGPKRVVGGARSSERDGFFSVSACRRSLTHPLISDDCRFAKRKKVSLVALNAVQRKRAAEQRIGFLHL